MRARVLVAALLVSVAASGCYTYEQQVATTQPKYTWVQAHYYWDSPTQKWLWRDGYYAALPPTATYVDAPAVSYSVGLSYGYPWYGWGPYYGGYYGYGYPGYYGHASYGHGHHGGYPGHYGTPRPSPAPRQPVIHVHPPSRRR